jgi:hypothetical protein
MVVEPLTRLCHGVDVREVKERKYMMNDLSRESEEPRVLQLSLTFVCTVHASLQNPADAWDLNGICGKPFIPGEMVPRLVPTFTGSFHFRPP